MSLPMFITPATTFFKSRLNDVERNKLLLSKLTTTSKPIEQYTALYTFLYSAQLAEETAPGQDPALGSSPGPQIIRANVTIGLLVLELRSSKWRSPPLGTTATHLTNNSLLISHDSLTPSSESPCVLISPEGSVEAMFLADTGSLAKNYSGNYIRRDYLSNINKKLKLPIQKGVSHDIIGYNGTRHSGPSEYIVADIKFTSRTGKDINARVKLHIMDHLATNVIIGRNTLCCEKLINSDHLYGFDCSEDDFPRPRFCMSDMVFFNGEMIHKNILGVHHGTYSYATQNLLASIEGQEHTLIDKDQRIDDENLDYYLDYDPRGEYEEGDLPSQIQGSEEFVNAVKALHIKFKNIFSKTLSQVPALVTPYRIDIDEEKWYAKANTDHTRPQSAIKQQAMDEYIREGTGKLFERSLATRACQVNMVLKPGSNPPEYRFTYDFRPVNECSKKIDYPIIKIEEIMARVANAKPKFFVKIDLTQGSTRSHYTKIHVYTQRSKRTHPRSNS